MQTHAKRIISQYCVLEVEAPSQTQMVTRLKEHSLARVKGGEGSGNVLIVFDVNSFGETITAPHIRRPPVVQEVWRKLVKSVLHVRSSSPGDVDVVDNLPTGDVFVVVDGGRVNNAMFAKTFGIGPGQKKKKTVDKHVGRNVFKQTHLLLDEGSVKARRGRVVKPRMTTLRCTQNLLIWCNSTTDIPVRGHKRMTNMSNLSNVFGPIALESWKSLPQLTISEKKAFWGKRRVACGGKTLTGEDEEEVCA